MFEFFLFIFALPFLPVLLFAFENNRRKLDKSKVKSKVKSNVICVNCETSWLDPGTNLCSYCGLDLYIVQKDSPKAISQTDKPKLDHKKHTVTCVNCNFKAINPTSNLCSNCGLDMLIKSSYKNCISCGSDYESKLTACPICGAN